MTASWTQFPTYPVPGREMRLTFAASVGGYVRVALTDAPRGSTYFAQLEALGPTAAIVLHEGDIKTAWKFVPDVAGRYVFTVYDITKAGGGYGGGYSRDPYGFRGETVNAATALYITAGSRMTLPVGPTNDRGELTFWIWESTVRATNEETHGETTPAILKCKSVKAERAAQDSTVATKLASLVDALASAISTPTISSTLNDLITKFGIVGAADNTCHCNETNGATQIHSSDDSDNLIDPSFRDTAGATSNPARLLSGVAKMRAALDQHMRNDAGGAGGTTPGTGSASNDYHVKTVPIADYQNAVLCQPPGSVSEASWCIGDIHRAYSAHILSTSVHVVADASYGAASLSALLQVCSAFSSGLALNNPTAQATSNAGAVRLAAEMGLTES